jgi:DNA-directed RNA polymerase specialized sigma24 family protein
MNKPPARKITMSDGSITHWLDELRAGDSAAVQPLWEKYFQQLVELARRRLGQAPRRAADEEDVALSAFKSFCLGVQQGRFPQLADRHNLWPLLVAITAHKCVDLLRREGRRQAEALPSPEALFSSEPTPAFAAQMAEECARLLEVLDRAGDADLRVVALGKLNGESTVEIAARLGCVRRTVERKLQVIARLWEREAPA